jgi:hypothetical protein
MNRQQAIKASNILSEIDSVTNLYEKVLMHLNDREEVASKEFIEKIRNTFNSEIDRLDEELEKI